MFSPQKLRSRVRKITDHGDHVYTVDLAPERPLPRFKPGQFLHLTLDDYGPSSFWPESRVFSIASSPAQRDHLKIAYSVRGRYTTRMENELHESCLVYGTNKDGKHIHVVCGIAHDTLWIITVYEPDPEEWIDAVERRRKQ